MTHARLHRWIAIGLLAALGAIRVPVHAQTESVHLTLPVLYRSAATARGWIAWLTTSRVAPGLTLAVTANLNGGEHLDYRLLISPDNGLTWRPATSQPWQNVLGPSYYWEDMLAARIIRVQGVVTLVARSTLADPLTLYVSTDLGDHWDARPIPALTDCPDFGMGAVLTTPAAPERLLLTGRCRVSSTADSRPVLLVSTDAARTWSILATWSDGDALWPSPTLASPVDPDVLYQYGQYNWQRTRDAAATWENVVIPGSQLVLSPNDVETLAVIGPSRGPGLTSRDGGLTWQSWPEVPCVDTVQQATGPIWLRGASETLMALCVGGPLIRSQDGGQTWESVSLPDGFYPTLLSADDSRPGGLYLEMAMSGPGVAHRLYRSPDSGATWQDVLDLTAP